MGYDTFDWFDGKMLLSIGEAPSVFDAEAMWFQQWTNWLEYSQTVSILVNGRSLALYRNIVKLELPSESPNLIYFIYGH